jgi:hypothetical protein
MSAGRFLRLLGSAVVAASGLSMVVPIPEASATTTNCLIINNAINASYRSLAAAIAGASPGATLWVGASVWATLRSQRI